MSTFRNDLAERAVSKPEFMSATQEFAPHPSLVWIAEALRGGVRLHEIASYAWAFQEQNELPVHVAARFRTIYRRIHRHLALVDAA